MVVYIVIGGQSQCQVFAEICLIADYLTQTLPNFCYERVEKNILEYPTWLYRVNTSHNWNHVGSPIVWKELLLKGSKAYYIGGGSDFLEYCHAYYNFDLYMGPEKYEGLTKNFAQLKRKIKAEKLELKEDDISSTPTVAKNAYVVCISGAACPLARMLTSRLLDMCRGTTAISKIFLFDDNCTEEFLESVETECSFIGTNYPGKVVKYCEKIGNALTISDLLIVLDHVPFDPSKSIGEWLHANMRLMQNLAIMINASASRSMYIILANLGPACFNATVLMHSVTVNVKNILVATSDLGLDMVYGLAQCTEVPSRTIYCPPIWGFVGINHLIDIHTTVHQYTYFEPYNRYTKIKNSSLTIGSVTPEMRRMEYLTHPNEDYIWKTVAERKASIKPEEYPCLNTGVALLNLIRIWIIEPNPDDCIVILGIICDGTFGLTFNGSFSQPARLFGKTWKPAGDFFMPKDHQVKLPYLQYIAELCMKMTNTDLPPIIPYTPCSCKKKEHKKKEVW